jgi:alpha-amylase
MPSVTLGFEVHQPQRLNRAFNPDYSRGKDLEELFDVYFNNTWNRMILERVAEKCYLPANEVILENIERHSPRFKVAYSLSGVFIEQCEMWRQDVLESFKQLASSKYVEILDQTYYHSLASLFPDRGEFFEQVRMHRELMRDLLGVEPKVFENTEFLYNNSIAKSVEEMGYKAMFTEGAERILGWRSPNYVYRAMDSDLKLLLKNYRLSDDVAFRFSANWWSEYPLTADKYAAWLSACDGDCVNLFMDYETIGEHHWKETGIFEFFRWLPGEVLNYENLEFAKPSEVAEKYSAVGEFDVNDFSTVSWADIERDTGAWLSNDMQRTCYNAIRRMEDFVKKTCNDKLLEYWRYFQISDHLYYMFIAGGGPGIVHGYFSQQTPVEAFHSFAALLSDYQEQVSKRLKGSKGKAAYILRILPPSKAMHYYLDGVYTGISAHSLEELRDTIGLVPAESIEFHLRGRDLENWLEFTVGDEVTARRIAHLRESDMEPDEAKRRIQELLVERCTELRGEELC